MREFLLCYYHQDAWVNHATHEEIWEDFFSHASSQSRSQLQAEATQLLARDTVAIRKFVQAYADSLMFKKSREYRTWAGRLSEWLNARSSPNTSLERTRDK